MYKKFILSGWPGSNRRPYGPKPYALPTVLHPELPGFLLPPWLGKIESVPELSIALRFMLERY